MSDGLLTLMDTADWWTCAEPPQPYNSGLSMTWVEALVDCPGAQGLYTYAVPADLVIQPGDILSVPFGAQQIGAIAIRKLSQPPEALDASQIRAVADVVSRGFFPTHYWALLEQVAHYYGTPLMQVVRVALPPGLLGRSQRRIRLKPDAIPPNAEQLLNPTAADVLTRLQSQKQGDYTYQYLQRQVRGAHHGIRDLQQRGWVESYLEPPSPIRPKQRQAVALVHPAPLSAASPKQQEVLDVLRRSGGELWLQELLQTCQVSTSVIKSLERKGWVILQTQEVLRADSQAIAPDQAKPLTTAQAAALSTIQTLTEAATVLLHGVTGSGKTEIYLQAIAPILERGQSALVLVPEIGLTPQLTDRFRARFGQRVKVYHSALSDGERYDTWRQMLNSEPQVVIGTRSAIFAPLPQLGLIVLDEEHDSSFKQEQTAPCYHTRTVAEWRSQAENCPLILGSATPSLESWVTAQSTIGEDKGALSVSLTSALRPSLYLSLPQRIHDRPLPPVTVVDMRQELVNGNRSMFSRSLTDALHHLSDTDQQGILFIPRRGHSTFVSCRSCGLVMQCPYCDISLTYHHPYESAQKMLRCHYCSYQKPHPANCPDCGSPYLKHFGIGTQRLVQELHEQFPALRCLRFDSDTTRTKGAHRALLDRFARREAHLLVGTQMLTKGIDLPHVTLVGVIAADGLLHQSDFRASERAFQTLTQVAGRAGRSHLPGRVILQTYSPQHPVIQAVQHHNYEQFVDAELQQRAALSYPPYGRLTLIRLSGMSATTVQQTAEQLADYLLETCCTSSSCELLGPAPASIIRIARRHRWQLLLKQTSPDPIQQSIFDELRSRCPSSVSLTLDIDPLYIQ